MNLNDTFNTVADIYDQIRPGYPAEMIHDAIRISNIPPTGKILEIGCGTGKATEMFSCSGYCMTCLDIGENLLNVARTKFDDNPNIIFQRSSFEEWECPDQFDLILATNSWHWVDKNIRYQKAFDLLSEQGALVLVHNNHVKQDEGFFAEVQNIYADVAPEMARTYNKAAPIDDQEGLTVFRSSARRLYPWVQTYKTEDYLKLLSTYSDHIKLSSTIRNELFVHIKNLIDNRYNGAVTKQYETLLVVYYK